MYTRPKIYKYIYIYILMMCIHIMCIHIMCIHKCEHVIFTY